jgi:cytochrome c biogenesis protein CcmG/thiol:disulfide interchange protein DsbE
MRLSRRQFVGALGLSAFLAACGSKSANSSISVDPAAQATRPVTVTGTPLAPLPSKGVDPAVGVTPPTLVGANFTGTPITITPGTGGPMMVVFVAHWCPHCQREGPRLVSWIAAGSPPANLQIFAVSTAVDKTAGNYPPAAWLAKVGWPKPVMADDGKGTAAQAWGLQAFPYFVLVGADGKVKFRVTGEVDTDELTKMINQALAS